jgi:hypothetical protein
MEPETRSAGKDDNRQLAHPERQSKNADETWQATAPVTERYLQEARNAVSQ